MGIFRTISVEAASGVAGVPASVSVEMTRQEVTAERPAELTATFHWMGDERVNTGDPLMSPVESVDPSPGLWLVVDSATKTCHDASRPECWRVDTPAGPPAGLGMPVNHLNPGESTSNELHVMTDYDLDGCMPRTPTISRIRSRLAPHSAAIKTPSPSTRN